MFDKFYTSLANTKQTIARLNGLSKWLMLQHQVLRDCYLVTRDQFDLVAERLIKLRKSIYWSALRYLLVGQAEPVANTLMNRLVGLKNNMV